MREAALQLRVEALMPEAGSYRAGAGRCLYPLRGMRECRPEASPRGGKACGILKYADLMPFAGWSDIWVFPVVEGTARPHSRPETPGDDETMLEGPAPSVESSTHGIPMDVEGAATATHVRVERPTALCWMSSTSLRSEGESCMQVVGSANLLPGETDEGPTVHPRSPAEASRSGGAAAELRTSVRDSIPLTSNSGLGEQAGISLHEGPPALERPGSVISFSEGSHHAFSRSNGPSPDGTSFAETELTGKRGVYVTRETERIGSMGSSKERVARRGFESPEAERSAVRGHLAGRTVASERAVPRLSSPDSHVRPGMVEERVGSGLKPEAEDIAWTGTERQTGAHRESKLASVAAPAHGTPSMSARERIIGSDPGSSVANPPAWVRLVERVAGALRTVKEGEVFKTRLRLHPPQLGSLEVEAEWSGTLKVSLQAQSHQAFTAIREGLEHLRQLLLAQGLPLQDLQLSMKGGYRRGGSGGELAPAFSRDSEAVAESAPETGTRGWRLGTLDLWV